MYVRIARFEGARPEEADAAMRFAEETLLPELRAVDGFAGYGMLADAGTGTALGLTFFETEQSLEAGGSALDAMTPPDEMVGKRAAVETYEVVTHEVRGAPTAARASRMEGPVEKMDEGIRHAQEEVLPRASQLDGWGGVVFLADRSAGKSLVITLWETAEARQASEEAANQLRQEAAEAGGETVAAVERYDVMALEVPVRAAR